MSSLFPQVTPQKDMRTVLIGGRPSSEVSSLPLERLKGRLYCLMSN